MILTTFLFQLVKNKGVLLEVFFDVGILTTDHIQEKQPVFVYIDCATCLIISFCLLPCTLNYKVQAIREQI